MKHEKMAPQHHKKEHHAKASHGKVAHKVKIASAGSKAKKHKHHEE